MENLEKVFKDKRVLVTGHTGFKGSWLTLWLVRLGAKVIGLSDDVPTTPSNFEVNNISKIIEDNRVDIRNYDLVSNIVNSANPDFVFHLAAQSLVRESYDQPLKTFEINAMGTANILQALISVDKKVTVVMITSDKAYDNVEWVWGYKETDRLGGKDPYSASKGMAELVIKTYFESFIKNKTDNITLGIARAGNVIGGGDWAKDRIVPDCIRSWSINQSVKIRNPNSTRPWQHVFEPLSGYLSLAEKLTVDSKINGEAYNFGPPANQNHTVDELIIEMNNYWHDIEWQYEIEKGEIFHEASLLKLNCDKALFDLNWVPTLNFEQTVKMTMEWYKEFYENESSNMLQFSNEQIDSYMGLAVKNNL
ncbi:CDP-glucose 4,6-dehydratase [Gammaproteobacteria bacterium]|nr:CDP-glucose 4,6-dehydratase [Gammaproteobacteria bacterium]